MGEKNMLMREINEGIEEYFLEKEQKISEELEIRIERAHELYLYLIKQTRWPINKWIKKEYELFGLDFIPEKIIKDVEKQRLFYFMRSSIKRTLNNYKGELN